MPTDTQLSAALTRRKWPLGVLAALATAIVLAVALVSSAGAAYPGSDGRIAFVRSGSIYTIKDTGTGLRRLTRTSKCSGPRWSPDGSMIAYVCRRDIWTMSANGAHKTQRTHDAQRYSDSRPSWSPNGKYLAFVKTKLGHTAGYLIRFTFATHKEVTFSTPYQSESPTTRQVKVKALPGAVAWGRALNAGGGSFASFILFNGAGTSEFCQTNDYCLDAVGAPAQNHYRNVFPSSEDATTKPERLIDPDWFPNSPRFGSDALTTQESCPAGHCTPTGIDIEIGSSPVRPGGYEAVYAPSGELIAYVHRHNGAAAIYTAPFGRVASDAPTLLTTGSQPDWQPLPVAPN